MRPSSVIWIGGGVETFRTKYLAQIKARESDTRVFQKNLLKDETPPPMFEDDDLTQIEKKRNDEYDNDDDEYTADYNDERIYDNEHQAKQQYGDDYDYQGQKEGNKGNRRDRNKKNKQNNNYNDNNYNNNNNNNYGVNQGSIQKKRSEG